ncbi:hypothetical protein Tco_0798946 [Tanacetum coccineum]
MVSEVIPGLVGLGGTRDPRRYSRVENSHSWNEGRECLTENLVEEPEWGRCEGIQNESGGGATIQKEFISASDTDCMWNTLALIIKDAAKETLVAVKQARSRELISCRGVKEKAYEELKKLETKEGANARWLLLKDQPGGSGGCLTKDKEEQSRRTGPNPHRSLERPRRQGFNLAN